MIADAIIWWWVRGLGKRMYTRLLNISLGSRHEGSGCRKHPISPESGCHPDHKGFTSIRSSKSPCLGRFLHHRLRFRTSIAARILAGVGIRPHTALGRHRKTSDAGPCESCSAERATRDLVRCLLKTLLGLTQPCLEHTREPAGSKAKCTKREPFALRDFVLDDIRLSLGSCWSLESATAHMPLNLRAERSFTFTGS